MSSAAFSTTGNGIQTWSGAARKAGRDVVIIGMDYIRQNLDIIKAGDAYGLVAQPLYEEGAKTAELAAALAEGKTVPYLNPLPATGHHRQRPRPLLQDPRQRRPVGVRPRPSGPPSAARRPPGEHACRMRPAPFVIEATGIVKSFSGVQALRGIDFRVRRGEIHALLGQNGAGKSTLVKILNGVHTAGTYDGTIRVNGEAVQFHSPGDARDRGIAYVPQEIEVFEQLTVAENVFAGQTSLGHGVLVSQRRLRQRTAALFRDFGLAARPRRAGRRR